MTLICNSSLGLLFFEKETRMKFEDEILVPVIFDRSGLMDCNCSYCFML